MDHPYKGAPDHTFWARAVAANYAPAALAAASAPLLRRGEKLASAGSCFAANLVPFLEAAGIDYVRTEMPPPAFREVYVEAFGYHRFSAAYGNIYTARHLLQLLQRALGLFHPAEDRWYGEGRVIDPFRPGLAFPAASDAEFDLLKAQHLDCTLAALRLADVFVFTLGLTEAWVSRADGAVFPACPGTIAGAFDPDRHAFHNFTVAQTTADLLAAFALIRTLNPAIRFVLTVSPVPLVATASGEHVLAASTYSKSVLRVAAREVTQALPDTRYFPAYEIITGPQAPHEFYAPNRRDVAAAAIETVMAAFLAACDLGAPAAAPPPDAAVALSAAIAEADCEEEASGR